MHLVQVVSLSDLKGFLDQPSHAVMHTSSSLLDPSRTIRLQRFCPFYCDQPHLCFASIRFPPARGSANCRPSSAGNLASKSFALQVRHQLGHSCLTKNLLSPVRPLQTLQGALKSAGSSVRCLSGPFHSASFSSWHRESLYLHPRGAGRRARRRPLACYSTRRSNDS